MAPANLHAEDRHLQVPQSKKLFFISPPPSPPIGWEMRNDEPPNKDVHAEDLAKALAKLHARSAANEASRRDPSLALTVDVSPRAVLNRQRTGSVTLVYHPESHGHSPDLPIIAVEDTTCESPGNLTPIEGVEKNFMQTARPPVELMESSS